MAAGDLELESISDAHHAALMRLCRCFFLHDRLMREDTNNSSNNNKKKKREAARAAKLKRDGERETLPPIGESEALSDTDE